MAYLNELLTACQPGSTSAAFSLLQQYFRMEWDEHYLRDGVHVTGPHKPLELRRMTGPGGCSFRSLTAWDNGQVDYAVEMAIGLSEEEAEVFSVRIVTPEALLKHASDEFRVLAHGGLIVVAQFEWREVLSSIENILFRCEAERFHESIWRLRRYFTLKSTLP